MTKCTRWPNDEVSAAGASICCGRPSCYDYTMSNIPCPSGKYSNGGTSGGDDPSLPSCVACDQGYMCPGGTDHIQCLTGSYQPEVSQTKYMSCEAGKYQGNTGRISALSAPLGISAPKEQQIPYFVVVALLSFVLLGSEILQTAR